MVKYIICAARKAGMTHEEFSAYWRNHHGSVVKSVPEFTRHVRKYVQCHLVGNTVPLGAVGAYDGVAELWFDSVEELETAFNEPRYLEIGASRIGSLNRLLTERPFWATSSTHGR